MMVSTAEVMIIVMGLTGAGKSSFLKLLTRNEEIPISHSECCTAEVKGYQADVSLGRKTYTVTFVDTPGFDDGREGLDDATILRDIALWLGRAYQKKIKVAGVIYIQRITDERPTRAMKRSLKVLQNMIGEDKLAIAHMVTNRWELVKASGDQESANEREDKLLGKGGYWHKWISDHGAGYSRHDNTYASAKAIIRKILQRPPAYVQIQTEIMDKKMPLRNTSAGKVVIRSLEETLQEEREEIADVEEEIVAEPENSEHQEELRKLRKRVEALEAQREKLEKESNENLKDSIMMLGLAVVCIPLIWCVGPVVLAYTASISTYTAGGVVVSGAVATIPRLGAIARLLF